MKISKKFLALLIAGTISLINPIKLENSDLRNIKIEKVKKSKKKDKLEEKVQTELTKVVIANTNVNIRENEQKTKEILPFSDINDISNNYEKVIENIYEFIVQKLN